MSSCNTSARRVALAPQVGRVLSVVLLLGGVLATGCKSAANEPDQPEPTPMVAPGKVPTMMGTPNSTPVTSNMQSPPPASTTSDAALMPVDAGFERVGDATVPDPDPMDAGTWVPPDPTCSDGDWHLAAGMLPAKHVDYLADRDLRFPDAGVGSPMATQPELVVISSAGVPCGNAHDPDACKAALALRPQIARHLVTTTGDTVRLWQPPSLPLLGQVDTPAEAIWVFQSVRGPLSCDATFSRDGDDTIITGLPNWSCMQLPDGGQRLTASVRITPKGELYDVYNDAGMLTGACE